MKIEILDRTVVPHKNTSSGENPEFIKFRVKTWWRPFWRVKTLIRNAFRDPETGKQHRLCQLHNVLYAESCQDALLEEALGDLKG